MGGGNALNSKQLSYKDFRTANDLKDVDEKYLTELHGMRVSSQQGN